MADKAVFSEQINQGYGFKGEFVQIGAAMLDGEVIPGAKIFLPLKTMNRKSPLPFQKWAMLRLPVPHCIVPA